MAAASTAAAIPPSRSSTARNDMHIPKIGRSRPGSTAYTSLRLSSRPTGESHPVQRRVEVAAAVVTIPQP
ncbi:hypothetical protein Taro_030463, partial [Colocasia esculenta]|nr:hypothetical protein [Colocasia esculenta]